MKYSQSYAATLHNLSYDSFFIHYWTKSQIHIFKNYTNSVNYSTVHIDATGSLVKKLKDDLRISNNIFLYAIVIHLDNKAVCIAQMLSESHDTSTIEYWLNKWIKDVKKVPQESITDFSLALIGASCRAFNECSIKSYISRAISILKGNPVEKPRCYLRIDVAHLIKLVSRWKCFENKPRLVKKFYIRCIALMVKCTSNKELQRIILNTLILCKSDTYGNTEKTGETTNCERAKNFLGRCIEVGDPDSLIPESFSESVKHDIQLEDNLEIPNTVLWIKNIVEESDVAAQDIGVEPNPYFCPQFEKHIMKILQYTPLWTSVMKDIFQSPNERASSAIVECYFSILKQIIMEHNKRPLRIDRFIACHLKSISGNVNIVAASVKEQALISDDKNIPGELEEEESWKGRNIKKEIINKQEINLSENKLFSEQKKFCYENRIEKNSESNYKIESENLKKETAKNKQKKNTYLSPCPNIKYILHSPSKRSENLPIIVNGNYLEPLKIGKYSYEISNTCPFDALMHGLSVICIDNENYKNYVTHLQSDFFQCLKFYVENGVNNRFYKMRKEILEKLYPVKESHIKNLFNINAEDTMGNITSKLFKDAPSAVEISVCPNTSCISTKETSLVFWPIKSDIDITELYSAVISAKSIRNRHCLPPCGLRRTVEIFSKEHLIIEPIFKDNSSNCNIKDLPVSITFENKNYMLGAVIMFVNGNHFITYCRRKNNVWELYDDLKTSVISANLNAVVGKIQIIIYAKIF